MIATTSLALADDSWTLTDASLSPTSVHDVAIYDNAVVAAAANRQEQRTAIDTFVSLSRAEATTTLPANAFVLHTLDGQRWVGSPLSSNADTITWSTLALGERSIPLSSVVAIDHTLSPPGGDAPQEDVATLANRDSVRGVLASIDAESLVLTIGDAPTTVALANLSGIRLASTGDVEPSKASFAITLIDGSLVYVDRVDSPAPGTPWTLTHDEKRVTLNAEQIVRIDHLAGPVRWLSSVAPTSVLYTPYLGENYPPVMDGAVGGEAIRFGDRTYSRGIGVHARTRLTYALDGRHQSFRTRLAADPAMTLTDAVVRIKVDDKVTHESQVRSGALSPVIWVDLKGAKLLTLEVDFGAGLHTQDRINWIEPALMQAPIPTTRPVSQ